MARLTDKQIAAVCQAAGFPDGALNTAVAVVLAESGGDPAAINRSNSNGSTDYGLFQINSIHAELLNENPNWRDPVTNAKMALVISSNGSNWNPWTVYPVTYRKYLPRARKATGNPGELKQLVPPGPDDLLNEFGEALPNPLSPINDFFGMLTNPATWLRLGFFIIGGTLILIAFLQLTRADNIVAKGAVKVGAAFATKGKTL